MQDVNFPCKNVISRPNRGLHLWTINVIQWVSIMHNIYNAAILVHVCDFLSLRVLGFLQLSGLFVLATTETFSFETSTRYHLMAQTYVALMILAEKASKFSNDTTYIKFNELPENNTKLFFLVCFCSGVVIWTNPPFLGPPGPFLLLWVGTHFYKCWFLNK